MPWQKRETLRVCDLFFQWPDHRGSSNLAECGSRVGHVGETSGFWLKFVFIFGATCCLVISDLHFLDLRVLGATRS